jgi:hypothetical protein
MSTNYPSSKDSYTNPSANSPRNNPSLAQEITDKNDAILALETKVGINSSADTNSLDYKISQVIDQLLGTQSGVILSSPIFQGVIDGWNKFNQTITRVSGTQVSGIGFLAQNSVGDKFKADQVVPLTSQWSFDTNSSDGKGVASMSNIGTPTYTAGKFGNALTLNGTDQALSITDAAVFKPTGAFTIGMWIKKSAAVGENCIFQSYSNISNAAGIKLYVTQTTGKLEFATGNNAGQYSLITGGTTIDTNYHYVVVEWQENFAKIFLDGVLEVSGYMAAPVYNATNYVRIGCARDNASNASWFKGQIDDLFFINGHAVDQYWVAAKYAADTAQGTADITTTYQGYVTAFTDTTLTLTGGSDYVLYNSTLSSPYYSKSSSPVGFPQWFNWTITVQKSDATTALTATQRIARFCLNGRIINYRVLLQAVGNPGGNIIYLSTPITAKSDGYDNSCGAGDCNDGANGSTGKANIQSGGTKIYVALSNGAAWGVTSNTINLFGSYEI